MCVLLFILTNLEPLIFVYKLLKQSFRCYLVNPFGFYRRIFDISRLFISNIFWLFLSYVLFKIRLITFIKPRCLISSYKKRFYVWCHSDCQQNYNNLQGFLHIDSLRAALALYLIFLITFWIRKRETDATAFELRFRPTTRGARILMPRRIFCKALVTSRFVRIV